MAVKPFSYIRDKIRGDYYQVKDPDATRNIGDLTSLITTAKNSLVAAINEIAGQGGGTDEIFWATHGTTTSAQIEAAYQAGMLVVCEYYNLLYIMSDRRTSTSHFFVCSNYGKQRIVLHCLSNTWSTETITFLEKPSSASDGDVLTYSNNEWIARAPASAPVSSVDGKTGAVTVLPSGGSTGQVLKKSSDTNYDVEWANESGGGGSSPTPYTSNPAALGTASPGLSDDYARGDHVHAMPTAANVGAIAAPSSPSVGDFLVYTSNGWAAQSLSTWQGGSY